MNLQFLCSLPKIYFTYPRVILKQTIITTSNSSVPYPILPLSIPLPLPPIEVITPGITPLPFPPSMLHLDASQYLSLPPAAFRQHADALLVVGVDFGYEGGDLFAVCGGEGRMLVFVLVGVWVDVVWVLDLELFCQCERGKGKGKVILCVCVMSTRRGGEDEEVENWGDDRVNGNTDEDSDRDSWRKEEKYLLNPNI